MPVKKSSVISRQSSEKKIAKKTSKKEVNNTVEKTVRISQIFKGRVVAAKTIHTATVLLERRKTHPLYKKSFARSKKYLVHDDLGVKAGDLVEITKCKPISKNKHFEIIKVVGRDMEAIITEKLKEEAQAAIEEVLPAGRQVMPIEKIEESSVVSPQIEEENRKPKKISKRKEKSES